MTSWAPTLHLDLESTWATGQSCTNKGKNTSTRSCVREQMQTRPAPKPPRPLTHHRERSNFRSSPQAVPNLRPIDREAEAPELTQELPGSTKPGAGARGPGPTPFPRARAPCPGLRRPLPSRARVRARFLPRPQASGTPPHSGLDARILRANRSSQSVSARRSWAVRGFGQAESLTEPGPVPSPGCACARRRLSPGTARAEPRRPLLVPPGAATDSAGAGGGGQDDGDHGSPVEVDGEAGPASAAAASTTATREGHAPRPARSLRAEPASGVGAEPVQEKRRVCEGLSADSHWMNFGILRLKENCFSTNR
ncbi:uncharacterized protein LOC116420061 [Sarcophilus harrisii]|uniref:uncharacterized protein LOC116420061 n=1 Tax=Sarcophilus harrisii TaxID=9305 RepID=UPI001301E1EB|nr:uncharacterized protein LOC116420061 [Sarcophilus harrisii]